LLEEHPNGEVLSKRMDEVLETFEKRGKLEEGLDKPEGPLLSLAKGTAVQEMLLDKKDDDLITAQMGTDGVVTLAGAMYGILHNKDKQLIDGEKEAVSLEAIKLRAKLKIESKIQDLERKRAEEEAIAENPSQSINL
jgi:hypothetical protein